MFCPTMKNKYRTLLQQFDAYVDQHVDTALAITATLKNLLASPVADMITAIIPGQADDHVKELLIAGLQNAIEVLSIADTCKLHTDMNDKLKCFMLQLGQREPQLQETILQKLASLLTAHLDGQRLRQHFYDLFTQAKYTAGKV